MGATKYSNFYSQLATVLVRWLIHADQETASLSMPFAPAAASVVAFSSSLTILMLALSPAAPAIFKKVQLR